MTGTGGLDAVDAEDAVLPGMPGPATRRRSTGSTAVEPAERLPVAQVLVSSPLAHLDRPFDYVVPSSMDEDAQPGVRVKVRFAGKQLDGFVVARSVASEAGTHGLSPLLRVVSPEPVLTPAVHALARVLAERHAASVNDVVRLAVPPRHATTEKESGLSPAPRAGDLAEVPSDVGAWGNHAGATGFLDRLAAGEAVRAVAALAPGDDWSLLSAQAVRQVATAGRGVIVCVPDARDLERIDAALTATLGPDQHVVLHAGVGPAARYRAFLAISRGDRSVVVGNRSAALAPVRDLGLTVIYDDGDDLYAEPRAPYHHARSALLQRAHSDRAAALLIGYARSPEAQLLVDEGWAAELATRRDHLRERAKVHVAGSTDRERERDPLAAVSRIPSSVHAAIRKALDEGPVLVQAARSGHSLSLRCARCYTPAACSECGGPLSNDGPGSTPRCSWCTRAATQHRCAECDSDELRAPVIGERRTAEELGRAFAKTRVVASGGDRVVASVPDRPAIVVATPGAEPVAEGGYAAVVLLDGDLLLSRPGLRTHEEALRRWSNAVGLIRPGGSAFIVADPQVPAVQALVRWDQAGFARAELEQRSAARLPPAARVAVLAGDPGALDDARNLLDLPPAAEVVETDPEQVVIRVPRRDGLALSRALGQMQRVRSARKLDPVRVQIDPLEVL